VRRSLIAGVLGALVTAAFPLQPTHAGGVSYLRVYPDRVHSNDYVYVSGTNLVPDQQIWFLWACPTWNQQDPRFQNWGTLAERPVSGGRFASLSTDSQGNIVGIPMQVHLNGIRASACQVYVKYPSLKSQPACAPLCPDIAGQFTIIRGTLSRCELQICAKLIPRPQTIHAGFAEAIAIKNGWGGATARVKLVFQHPANGLPKTINLKPLTLDWNGQAHTRVFLPLGYAHAGKVSITAKFVLGGARGNSGASFTVVK
jgi:hypothetical protein